jgi:glutathione S-transferase
MAELTLYHYPTSFRSQIVRVLLAEANLDYTPRVVDLGPAHENYQPWFLRLSPEAYVPVLQHGDTQHWQMSDIVGCIHQLAPEAGLVPEPPAMRDAATSWTERLLTFPERELRYALMRGFAGAAARRDLARRERMLQRLRRGNPESDENYDVLLRDVQRWRREIEMPDSAERLVSWVEQLLDELEAAHASGWWLAGEAYCAADAVATVMLARLEVLGFDHFWEGDRRPAVAAYYGRAISRASFSAAPVYRRDERRTLVGGLVRAFGSRVGRHDNDNAGVG